MLWGLGTQEVTGGLDWAGEWPGLASGATGSPTAINDWWPGGPQDPQPLLWALPTPGLKRKHSRAWQRRISISFHPHRILIITECLAHSGSSMKCQ